MNKYFVGSSLCVKRRSLAPIVAACVREEISLCVETSAGNRSMDIIEPLESLLVAMIPKRYTAITTDSSKCAKGVIETNGVDTVHCSVLSMTLEGKRVSSWYFLKVMNTHATFDTSNGKAGTIGKARNASGLILERRFTSGVFTWFRRDIVSNNVSSGRSDDHEIIAHIHVIDAIWQFQNTHRIGLSGIPKL